MNKEKQKILFAVQGEGRGHLTQAITLYKMLTEAGYDICCIMVGSSENRKLPDFFYANIQAPVIQYPSPNFVTDAKMKTIKIWPSIYKTAFRLGRYIKSVRLFRETVAKYKPDAIINFYEPIVGLSNLFKKPPCPVICVAHQYIYHHPDFEFPEGRLMDRMSLKNFTELTAFGATKRLGISIYPLENYPGKNIIIVPPLLREAVFEANVSEGDYLLIYLLNKGYSDDIIAWHNAHPETELHCFTDRTDVDDVLKYDDTLHFHKINDKKFLDLMAGAKGFISTAGFESVCEAMYLGKPVLMVPVEGHFEQFCNSRDATKAGAGIYDSAFNISKLIDYLPNHHTNYKEYRLWVNCASIKVVEEINKTLGGGKMVEEAKMRKLA